MVLEYNLGLVKSFVKHIDIPVKSAYKGVQQGWKTGEVGRKMLDNFHDMVDQMPESTKIKFMRSIGYGSVGSMFLAIGAANPEMFNGYDGLDKKRKRGGMIINGHEAPSVAEKVLHAFPGYATAQVGATIVHFLKHYEKLHKSKMEAMVGAGVSSVGGMIKQEQPFVSNQIRVVKKIDNGQYMNAVVEVISNIVIPNEVQRTAERLDQDNLTFYKFWFGEPKKRSPGTQWLKGAKETLEEKIPGLRQLVPQSKGGQKSEIQKEIDKASGGDAIQKEINKGNK
jgi:hypothetical protein